MREIHVCTYNVKAYEALLVDLLDWLSEGLKELGIGLTRSDTFRADTANIIFEFSNVLFHGYLNSPEGRGLKLICFVTEYILNGTEFDHYGHAPPGVNAGKLRFDSFMSIADHYAGFITTVPHNVPFLQRLAPTTFFEFGYIESLVQPSSVADCRYDVSFLGAITDYRRDFLTRLSDHVPVHVPGLELRLPGGWPPHTVQAVTTDQYVDTMRQTALNIGLKQHPRWRLPSPTKIARALHGGAMCAVEETEETTRQAALIPTFKDVPDFVEKFGRIDRTRMYERARETLEAYRATLPMRRELERNFAECPALTTG